MRESKEKINASLCKYGMGVFERYGMGVLERYGIGLFAWFLYSRINRDIRSLFHWIFK